MLMTTKRKHTPDQPELPIVGDKPSDLAAGSAAGCQGILFGTGAAGWRAVVRRIERDTRKERGGG